MKNYLLTKTASVFSSKNFLTVLIFIFLPFVAMAQAASDVVQPPKEFDPSGWNWVSICYIVLAVLILLIIARVFDIGSLTEKVTGRKVINWDKANGWIAILFLIGSIAGVWYEMIYHGKHVMIGNSYSEHGETIDSMFNWTFGFTFVVFAITEALLFYFMFRYSYRENKKALYYFHNNKLELVWTVVPAIVLTFLVLRGFNTWSRITAERPKNSQEIEVFAYQFGWKARYAGADNKFGAHHFTFISGKNPLGLAVDGNVDSLVAELQADIKGIDAKIASAPDSAKSWEKQFAAFNVGSNAAAYPAVYKDLKTKMQEGNSGAYVERLKKDKRRKNTTLNRVLTYRKDNGIFNNAANDDKVTTEIVLVKGKSYTFNFRARDVIHSAWFPDFRGQMNVVPGMATWFSFVPTKTTAQARIEKNNPEFEFYLYCNKICGAAHYNMKIKMTVVESEAEYNTWLAAQPAVVAPPAPATAPGDDKKEQGKDSGSAPQKMAMITKTR
jgi:cytochrome c oxidase subunit 2